MHKTIKVVVTQKDIEDGIPADGERCAVVLAVERQYPELGIARTDGETLEIGEAVYAMPKVATDFVDKFDAEETVEPFEFEAVLT